MYSYCIQVGYRLQGRLLWTHRDHKPPHLLWRSCPPFRCEIVLHGKIRFGISTCVLCREVTSIMSIIQSVLKQRFHCTLCPIGTCVNTRCVFNGNYKKLYSRAPIMFWFTAQKSVREPYVGSCERGNKASSELNQHKTTKVIIKVPFMHCTK